MSAGKQQGPNSAARNKSTKRTCGAARFAGSGMGATRPKTAKMSRKRQKRSKSRHFWLAAGRG
jgi:hypothetical protein